MNTLWNPKIRKESGQTIKELIMRRASIILFLISTILSSDEVVAQRVIYDLEDAILQGHVAIEQMRGNGSSSGTSIEGRIRNSSQRTVRINVNLRKPMYLGNRTSSARQNMVAFSIYQRGGRYFTEGLNAFIEVTANQSLDVQFVAYCADFEKDNPSSADQFVVASVPDSMSGIIEKIANYKRLNPNDDVTVAAQVALWLAQGVAPDQIRTTFQFSQQDERTARAIINR
jgi:hypothetical protein